MEKGKIAKEKRRRWEKDPAETAVAGASRRNKKTVAGGREDNEDKEDGEVEEFFAIVTRMQVAVKYFDRGNINGQGWLAAVESVAGDGQKLEEKGAAMSEGDRDLVEEEEERGSFDLNVVPPVKG